MKIIKSVKYKKVLKKLLYIWKEHTLWDVRFDKFFHSLSSAGYEIYLLARWKAGFEFPEQTGNAKVITAGKGKSPIRTEPVSFNPVWKNAIENAVRQIKPNIIMPREIMLAGAAAAAGKKFGIPVIMDMAENYPAAMKEWKKYKDSFIKRLFVHHLDIPEKVEAHCVPEMDGIITVCREQSDRLAALYGYPIEKTTVVHNTPLPGLFQPNKRKAGKANIFGHHGNVTGDKRIESFIAAFIEAAKIDRDIELHLYGAGEYFGILEDMINRSHCPERIKLTGRYDFADIPKIVGSLDIGILPYQTSDFNNTTLHNKVFDFLAAGKPVILSETKPFKRLLEETKAGILVDCTNTEAITEVILNINNYDLKSMSENALTAAYRKYNWQADGSNLVSFLEEYI